MSGDGEGVRQGAILGGTDDAAYLAIGEEQRAAVVRLEATIGGARIPICSGVLLLGDVVLTAKHCVESRRSADLQIRLGYLTSIAVATVERVSLHPEVDVAALELRTGTAESFGVRALMPVTAVDGSWVGRRAVLGGYGENGEDSTQRLLFATEAISEVEDLALTTAGHGLSGACVGDSGGPLLARDASGRAVVLGILASGAASCLGNDHFARLDRQQAWLETVGIGQAGAGSEGCGLLSKKGRCFDGQAVWCEGNEMRTETCSLGRSCGYSAELDAYRCTEAARGCTGADDFGACLDGQVLFCSEAGGAPQDCGICRRCGFDSRTGKAGCFPKP